MNIMLAIDVQTNKCDLPNLVSQFVFNIFQKFLRTYLKTMYAKECTYT